MDYKNIINKIYNDLEHNKLVEAVTSCLRLAQLTNDYWNTMMFVRELVSDKFVVREVFDRDTRHLNEEARRCLWKTSLEYWAKGRVVDYFNKENEGEERSLPLTIGEILAGIEQLEKVSSEQTIPSGMSPFDTAYFTDKNNDRKLIARNSLIDMHSIKERVRARCIAFVTTKEKQIEIQEKNQNFLFSVQNDVNNYFKGTCEDVYQKLQKASDLSFSSQQEDYSLLLTEIRRAIKAVADYFHPAKEESVLCSDGKKRMLTDEKYLNRLHEFLAEKLNNTSSDDLLKSEYEHFVSFIEKLNNLSCKGVHTAVAVNETKQAFLGLYMFLYSFCCGKA